MKIKTLRLFLYFFIWYPCLGFIMAWIHALYQELFFTNVNLEEGSFERIENSLNNSIANFIRIFQIKINIFNVYNFDNYLSNTIAILLFIFGIVLFLSMIYAFKIFKKNIKVNKYFVYFIIIFNLILYFLTFLMLISPMIFEGFLLSTIIFAFYKLNKFIVGLTNS
jgi:hypothetical protein